MSHQGLRVNISSGSYIYRLEYTQLKALSCFHLAAILQKPFEEAAIICILAEPGKLRRVTII